MGGRAHKRTRAPSGRADGLAGRRMGRRADEGGHAGRTSGRGRTMDGRADEQTGRRRISEGKTPNLTRHLTWPWEIQRGRPRVTVKLPDLPPPSQ